MISTEQLRKLEDMDVEQCNENGINVNKNSNLQKQDPDLLLNNDLEIKYHNSLSKVENVVSNIHQTLSSACSIQDADGFVDQVKKILSSFFKIQTLISSIHALDSLVDSFKDGSEYEHELLEYIEDFELEYQNFTSLELPHLQNEGDSKIQTRKQLSDVTSRYIHLKKDYELLLSRVERADHEEKRDVIVDKHTIYKSDEYKELSERFKTVIQDSMNKETQIADLKRQISEREKNETDEIQELKTKILHLKAKNDDYKTQVETIKSRLDSEQTRSNADHKTLESRIMALTSEIADLKSHNLSHVSDDSEETIKTLKSQLNNTTSHVHQLTSHIQTLTDHIHDISGELEQKTQQNNDLMEQLNSINVQAKDGEDSSYISSLEATIKKLERQIYKMRLLLSISTKL